MKELMKNIMNENLVQMIISNPKQGEVIKIKIRPVFIQDQLVFQKTEYIGTKVFHENLEQTDAQAFAEKVMMEQFKQCQIETETEQISVLVSKKGKVTIKRKKLQNAMQHSSRIFMRNVTHARIRDAAWAAEDANCVHEVSRLFLRLKHGNYGYFMPDIPYFYKDRSYVPCEKNILQN